MSTNIKTILPVTELTINALEAELELLEMAYGIFKGSVPGEVITFSESVSVTMTAYGERIRDIRNEIFERQVLVKS